MGWQFGQMRVLGASYLHLVAHYNTLSMSSAGHGTTDPTEEYMENSIATVQAYPDSGYDFAYWLYDGWLQLYGSTQQICMAEDHTLTAYFTPSQPDASVTIDAYNVFWGMNFEVYPEVYIDGNYVGTAPLQVTLSPGTHSIWVSESVYDENWGDWFGLSGMYYNYQQYYSQPITVPVYSANYYTVVYG
jgi:hypothetical protein